MLPAQTLIVKFAKKYQKNMMKYKSERIQYISELFNNIKIIKMYHWEIPFAKLSQNCKSFLPQKKIKQTASILF